MTFAALAAIYFVHLVLLAARTSLKEGMRRGAYLAIGIGLGACVWAVAALLGLGLLFKHAPALLTALKFGGAAYLIYLAWKMWRHAPDPIEEGDQAISRALSPLGLIWLGITTQLANPKPAVFFGTIFLTFIPVDAPLWAFGVILAMIFVNDCGWNIIVARIFSLERTRRGYLNLKTTIDRCFGGLLALLGTKLALT
jgi:threonine/homoserine/homoserine lactone efflux protein